MWAIVAFSAFGASGFAGITLAAVRSSMIWITFGSVVAAVFASSAFSTVLSAFVASAESVLFSSTGRVSVEAFSVSEDSAISVTLDSVFSAFSALAFAFSSSAALRASAFSALAFAFSSSAALRASAFSALAFAFSSSAALRASAFAAFLAFLSSALEALSASALSFSATVDFEALYTDSLSSTTVTIESSSAAQASSPLSSEEASPSPRVSSCSESDLPYFSARERFSAGFVDSGAFSVAGSSSDLPEAVASSALWSAFSSCASA